MGKYFGTDGFRGEANVGFAYDGDADRCIAVDEKGEVVNGDLILYLCGT